MWVNNEQTQRAKTAKVAPDEISKSGRPTGTFSRIGVLLSHPISHTFQALWAGLNSMLIGRKEPLAKDNLGLQSRPKGTKTKHQHNNERFQGHSHFPIWLFDEICVLLGWMRFFLCVCFLPHKGWQLVDSNLGLGHQRSRIIIWFLRARWHFAIGIPILCGAHFPYFAQDFLRMVFFTAKNDAFSGNIIFSYLERKWKYSLEKMFVNKSLKLIGYLDQVMPTFPQSQNLESYSFRSSIKQCSP